MRLGLGFARGRIRRTEDQEVEDKLHRCFGGDTKDAIGGHGHDFNGVLQGQQDGKVRLVLESGEAELDLGNIERARLVPKFD